MISMGMQGLVTCRGNAAATVDFLIGLRQGRSATDGNFIKSKIPRVKNHHRSQFKLQLSSSTLMFILSFSVYSLRSRRHAFLVAAYLTLLSHCTHH
jgi:hypothetical protein